MAYVKNWDRIQTEKRRNTLQPAIWCSILTKQGWEWNGMLPVAPTSPINICLIKSVLLQGWGACTPQWRIQGRLVRKSKGVGVPWPEGLSNKPQCRYFPLANELSAIVQFLIYNTDSRFSSEDLSCAKKCIPSWSSDLTWHCLDKVMAQIYSIFEARRYSMSNEQKTYEMQLHTLV